MLNTINPNSITLVSFSDGQWVNAEQTVVRGLLQWSIMDEASVGAVDLTEDYPHIQQLKSGIDAGNFGVIAAYVAPTQAETDAETSERSRVRRDNILATVVDPLVSNPLRWADLTADKQAEWSQYRTDLLAVPQQAGFPNNITWPQEPSA